jgi:hypothetical protein
VADHPTLDQLRQLGLVGTARAFEELAAGLRGGGLDHAEWLGLLLDRELADRHDPRLTARLRYARLCRRRGCRLSCQSRSRPRAVPEARPGRLDRGLEPLGPEQRRDLLEIIEERYGRGATLITSQIPIERWHDLIGDPTLADAILDRIVHNAHRIQLRGDSLRKKKAQEQG